MTEATDLAAAEKNDLRDRPRPRAVNAATGSLSNRRNDQELQQQSPRAGESILPARELTAEELVPATEIATLDQLHNLGDDSESLDMTEPASAAADPTTDGNSTDAAATEVATDGSIADPSVDGDASVANAVTVPSRTLPPLPADQTAVDANGAEDSTAVADQPQTAVARAKNGRRPGRQIAMAQPEPNDDLPQLPNISQQELIPEAAPPEVLRTPSQLKKVRGIMPYADYTPEGRLPIRNKCEYQCPRPNDGTCPDCPSGERKSADENSNCPECPDEVKLAGEVFVPRNFPHAHYNWEAADLWHYPLYFSDPDLERYGHTRHFLVQPFASATRFGGQFLLWPYQMSLNPPWCKNYNLGYYRPGRCVPYRYEQLPWNNKAAFTEAGAIVGGYYLFAPTP